MKTRFNTYDIVCSLTELQKLIGMRVNNVYDIDNKTYLIKLQRSEEKSILLLESGNRFHTTGYEWPKNMAPSGFSMKMRKHLKNKRLECIKQLGSDRIVDLQFGSSEAAYHVILELYDRGNIILTDYELTILNILRPHTEGEKVRFAVREKYPQNRARESVAPTIDDIKNIILGAKEGDTLKKALMPHLDYGPSLIEHVLLKQGFVNSTKIGKDFNVVDNMETLFLAICEAESIMIAGKTETSKGYIIQKKEERPSTEKNAEKEYYFSSQEFHPLLYKQHEIQPYIEYDCFNQAVDEFYSTLQGQKIDMKALQIERDAIKKLENVKKDHVSRLNVLEKTQENDKVKAELITGNLQLVDNAILAVRTAIANQVSWEDIEDLVKDAASKGDLVAKEIKHLKLETNHISIKLTDPYPDEDTTPVTMIVDVNLNFSAFANASSYYTQKRTAASKQQKTIDAQGKALKSAEKKTMQVLKEVKTTTSINKARKVYWFEKFFWFISSENYLVIGGRDQQQNEFIVKRYMTPSDIYVHADVHGASSIIIKNPSGKAVPPKTLNEAGTMAICYSVAWDAKVLTNAYWVLGEQVSKSAPTGEYLTTGSFMVRGKKNFLPPSHLVLGLGFLFRLEDGSIARHQGERKVVNAMEDEEALEIKQDDLVKDEEEEIVVSEGSDDEVEKDEDATINLEKIDEEINEIAKDDNSSSDDDEDTAFPDTQIKIKHFEGTKVNIETESIKSKEMANTCEMEDRMDKAKQRSRNNSEANTKNRKKSVSNSSQMEEMLEDIKRVQSKRRQKSKLKKIKEKYKDQDEEERQLRMNILQSSGPTTKKTTKKALKEANLKKPVTKTPRVIQPKEPNQDGVIVDDEPAAQADVDMIDALTGLPVIDDEILFAVPVVAPYNTLSQYKFKVKLTPGTSRRGKAAKTAVNMFIHDKTTSPREKDLLKAVKDELLARNIPGKVKLSAPRLQALRK